MRVAIVGSGAVGGYYGAQLARAGHDVVFIARGAHLAAIREHGLRIRSPLGDFTARGSATDDPAEVGPVGLVLVAVKTYDNATAMPMLAPLTWPDTLVLTLQNGVDSPDEAAAIVGTGPVLAGAAYIATAIAEPGVIAQTGTHRRIVFGEAFDGRGTITPRVARLRDELREAGIDAEASADGRAVLWSKLAYLGPFAGFTGAARLPIGGIWGPAAEGPFYAACREVVAVGRAEGVPLGEDVMQGIAAYMEALPPATRSSLLIDLTAGKRIEVEALQGTVVRRAARHGIDVPIMSTLYALLRPYADGPPA